MGTDQDDLLGAAPAPARDLKVWRTSRPGVQIGEPGEMRAYEFLSYWNVVESIADALGADPRGRPPAERSRDWIRDRLLGLFPAEELDDVVRSLA